MSGAVAIHLAHTRAAGVQSRHRGNPRTAIPEASVLVMSLISC
jgi:hypothetical protein